MESMKKKAPSEPEGTEDEEEEKKLLLAYEPHFTAKEGTSNVDAPDSQHTLVESFKDMFEVAPGAGTADICRLARLPIVTHVLGDGKPLKQVGAESCRSPFHANEDRVLIIDDFKLFLEGEEQELADLLLDKLMLIVVLDGHGGSWAASYTQLFFPRALLQRLRALCETDNQLTVENLKDALFQAVVQLDEEVVGIQRVTGETSGCCFICAALYLDSLVVANAGDCRAIKLSRTLSRASVSSLNAGDYCHQLSDDHTVKLKCERLRVVSEGGRVIDNRINGILEPSRAIGDVDFKPSNGSRLLIADPDVRIYSYQPGQEMLVLATDGVWDVLTNNEVVGEVQFSLQKYGDDPRMVAGRLQSLGSSRGYDDVSVVVVAL